SGGSVQQARSHHLGKSIRSGRHVVGDGGARGAQSEIGAGGHFSRLHTGSVFWAVQIRIVAGTASAGKTFLGQRHLGTRDFPCHHHRKRERLVPRRGIRWARSLFRG